MLDAEGKQARSFSIVIPAHDEEAVIARCLQAFLPELEQGEASVVVAANGCQDRTVEIARSFAGVRVLDLPDRSKTAALNAADDVLDVFPRIYVDADIVVNAAALRAVAGALSGPEPRVASPRIRFQLAGRPRTVRLFYAAYERLPYVQDELIGLGVYGLSAAGRQRVGRFPDVTADDLFVDRQFDRQERSIVADEEFRVEVPHTLRDLVAVRARAARGSRDLAATDDQRLSASTTATVKALATMVRREPRMALPALTYVAVTLAARLRVRATAGSSAAWERDTSSRAG